MRWKLTEQVWFWITMAFVAALHVQLILFISWTTKWIPTTVIIPIDIANYAMLWVVSVIWKFIEGPNAAEM